MSYVCRENTAWYHPYMADTPSSHRQESSVPTVVAVTITHGHRWQFLQQVVAVVLADSHISRFIIVDNGSQDSADIHTGTASYGDRIRIVTNPKNLGSAGGFGKGIEAAREEVADYVLLLDDDSVPEDNFVEKYYAAQMIVQDPHAVIAGMRSNVGDAKDFFYPRFLYPPSWYRKTFFEVFSVRKAKRWFRRVLFGTTGDAFVPLLPVKAFVYGGAFLPMEAIRKAPLPDATLFLYGDDIDYAWGVGDLGYAIYATATPFLHDVDMTFPGSHITGLFDENVPVWKVYYRLRNMVRLSVKHKAQNKIALLINVCVWFAALLVIGLWHTRGQSRYWERASIIVEALRAGYDTTRAVPSSAVI